MDKLRKAIRVMVNEEMGNMLPAKTHDHEAKMAKGELRSMIKLGAELYNMIEEGDEIPGWISSYITLASDYINSAHESMTQSKQ